VAITKFANTKKEWFCKISGHVLLVSLSMIALTQSLNAIKPDELSQSCSRG